MSEAGTEAVSEAEAGAVYEPEVGSVGNGQHTVNTKFQINGHDSISHYCPNSFKGEMGV